MFWVAGRLDRFIPLRNEIVRLYSETADSYIHWNMMVTVSFKASL